MMDVPKMALLLLLMRKKTLRILPRPFRRRTSLASNYALPVLYPGVDWSKNNVCGEIGDNDHEGDNVEDGLHCRIVIVVYGTENPPAHTLVGKYALRDQRSG